MKIITALLYFFTFCNLALSQSISSEVVASLGGEYSTESSKVTFTLGETATTFYSNNSIILSEGFHQSYQDVISAIEELPEVTSFRMYPNPTDDLLILEVDGKPKDLRGEIYNSSGQMVSKFSVKAFTEVNLSQMAPGQYFIRLSNKSNKSESFSVIKH